MSQTAWMKSSNENYINKNYTKWKYMNEKYTNGKYGSEKYTN